MANRDSSYDFLAPRQIIFGWGRWREVAGEVARLGSRALVVSGSRTLAGSDMVAQLREMLREAGVECLEVATVTREPRVADVDACVAHVRQMKPGPGDVVIALGGGSAIDFTKAIAALATNTAGESVRDYLEGVGRGLQVTQHPLPIVAVPTTAGTGSEATKNAVISSFDPPFKKSLRSNFLMPQVVVVDPELSVSLPPKVTAYTGMDAITQLIESYISRKARPIAQSLAIGGLPLALGAIVEAFEDGSSRNAREAMSHAALLSGMALANSGLGMAHGVAASLGIHCDVPHGLACAVMLPVALRVNREACARQLEELADACKIPGNGASGAERLLSTIEEIGRRLKIPERLSQIGVTREQLPALVRDSRGNSMDGNPVSLSDEELFRILEAQL